MISNALFRLLNRRLTTTSDKTFSSESEDENVLDEFEIYNVSRIEMSSDFKIKLIEFYKKKKS